MLVWSALQFGLAVPLRPHGLLCTMASVRPATQAGSDLVRGLTLTHTTALAVGAVIGTGVFLKAATMAQLLGRPSLVLAAWVAAGLLSLAGTFTYSELAAMMPHAGGEYVYLRTAYGRATAFCYGWMRFVVGTGGLSALAVGFATFLSAIVPLEGVWLRNDFTLLGSPIHWQFGMREIAAVAVLLLFGALNSAGVAFGGRVQSVFTTLKLASIACIAGGVFLFSKTASLSHLAAAPGVPAWTGLEAFGAAMVAALWAYDGWAYMPMIAGEVRNPERNVPRALVVVAAYISANFAYFYALPVTDVATSNSTAFRGALPVASKAAVTFLGPEGAQLVAVMFIISVMGALQGVTLALARVPFAMARDGLFLARFGTLSKGSRAPVWAVAGLTLWAVVIALSGTFDQITNMVVFAQYVFHALTTVAVFVLRRKMPDAVRPYRTPGYPVVPLLFVLVAGWLILNTLKTSPVESLAGLALIAVGAPVYLYYRAKGIARV